MSMRIRSLALLVACLGFFSPSVTVRGQDGPPTPRPTAEHERLAKEVGTWDATIKSWMQGPGSGPAVSRGVQVAR